MCLVPAKAYAEEMARFRVAGLLAAAELAVAISRARRGGDRLRESTIDRFRRSEPRLTVAASLYIVSIAYARR